MLRGFKGVALAGLLLLVSGLAALAQDDLAADVARWDDLASRVEQELDNSDELSGERLNALRSQLVSQREQAAAATGTNSAQIKTLEAQIASLGDPPAEGDTEPEETANRRSSLNTQLSELRAPVIAAEEARVRADGLIAAIDAMIRDRDTEALLTRHESPVLPSVWASGSMEVLNYGRKIVDETAINLGSAEQRQAIFRNLPVAILYTVAGLWLLFWLGPRLPQIGRTRMQDASIRRRVVVSKLIVIWELLVPLGATLLLLEGFMRLGLVGTAGDGLLTAAIPFFFAMVIARWIALGLFAPHFAEARFVGSDDETALRGYRWMVVMGVTLGAAMFVQTLNDSQQLTDSTRSMLVTPLILIEAFALWRLFHTLRPLRNAEMARIRAANAEIEEDDEASRQVPVGPILSWFFELWGLAVAILAPIAALLGYEMLAGRLMFGTVTTFLLIGMLIVMYSIITDIIEAAIRRGKSGEGLSFVPIITAISLGIVGFPVMLLLWGVRPEEIGEGWIKLKEGVTFGGVTISPTDLVTFVIVFLIGYALTRLAQALMRSTVLPRTSLDTGAKNASVAGLGYVGILLAGIAAVSATGINLSSLAIVAGALSLGIGFGLQTIVSNFVSGIILLMERPVKEGDWIEVGAYSGYVRKVAVRATRIETFDRSTVIVPNENLISQPVLNWTHQSMMGRVIVPVTVAFGTDPRQVEEILLEIAEEHPMILKRPPPAILFMGFNGDGMRFEIRAYLRDVNYMLSATSDMNFDIVERFREADIEIPRAQQEVRFRAVSGSALPPAATPDPEETPASPPQPSDGEEGP
ncbi:DUF3772 domain-containing protein [Paracoccaceae bacterium GXU_MW_L88]